MRKLAVVSLVLVLAACGDSTGPEPIWGTYNLQTIQGGRTLPQVVWESGADQLEFMAGHIRLNSDMTCITSETFRHTHDGVVTTDTGTQTGTFTVSGSSLTFALLGWASSHGWLVDRRLIVTFSGFSWVFVKP